MHTLIQIIKTYAAALVVAFVAAVVVTSARADDDHDRALEAVRSGQVLPLKTVLQRLEREHPGQVLEIELERDDGRWIYEVKLLQTGGRLVKLEVDARSAEVIKRRGRDSGRMPRSGP